MSDDFPIAGDPSVLIPEGEYDAIVLSTKTLRKFNRPAVQMRFRIVGMHEFNGIVLSGWLPLGEGGKVAPRSKFVGWYLSLEDWGRKDRPSLLPFRQRLLRINVRTVTKDYKQKALPPQLYYSVVEEVLRTVSMLSPDANKGSKS